MKSFFSSKTFLSVFILCLSALAVGWFAFSASLKTEKEKTSYALGYNIGKSFESQKIEVNMDQLTDGLKDGLANKKGALSETEIRQLLTNLQQKVQNKAQSQREEALAKNIKIEKDFLDKNKKKKGVITTKSGLQYEILKKGTGKKPKETDRVKTHYKGTLINGEEFDSSYKRGQPATFGVNQVIKGWTEALLLMPVGSKWKLYIPSKLAYGVNPPPGSPIEPGSVLIFEIELLEIV